jgi:hypothetical protein
LQGRPSAGRATLKAFGSEQLFPLKTGQKAMWYAFGHRARLSVAEIGAKGGRGKSSSEPSSFRPPSGRLSEARKILDHSDALALDVLADRIPLDAALKTVHGDL